MVPAKAPGTAVLRDALRGGRTLHRVLSVRGDDADDVPLPGFEVGTPRRAGRLATAAMQVTLCRLKGRRRW